MISCRPLCASLLLSLSLLDEQSSFQLMLATAMQPRRAPVQCTMVAGSSLHFISNERGRLALTGSFLMKTLMRAPSLANSRTNAACFFKRKQCQKLEQWSRHVFWYKKALAKGDRADELYNLTLEPKASAKDEIHTS